MGLVGEFFSWWSGQLGDLVPEAWRRDTRQTHAALILTPVFSDNSAPAVMARLDRRGRARNLGRVALDAPGIASLKRAISSLGRNYDTLVEVPSDMLLEKRLTLPLAAERDLDRVLAYEMDRETPFSVDEVYWDSSVETRDRQQKRMIARLSMVAKAELADVVGALFSAGLAPRALVGTNREGQTRSIPLRHEGAGSGGWLAYSVPAAAIACAILAVAAGGLPFLRQALALGAVETRIDAAKPAVEAVDRLRGHIEGDRQQAAALAAQRAFFGDPLAMLAAVTAALPDDTRLTELSFASRKLVLTGQSQGAAHLIGDITGNALIKNPTFSAPVTRMEPTKVDIFTITADMGP
jgi:general secretion pathway protein L